MRPSEFCDVAERLLANDKTAGGFRSAISRSYYGAFHHARDFLSRMNVHPVGPNPHLEVISLLTGTGDAAVDEARRSLADLRVKRNVADYDLGDAAIEDETVATQCLDDARDVVAKLSGCRISPARFAAVTAAVRATAKRLRGLPP